MFDVVGCGGPGLATETSSTNTGTETPRWPGQGPKLPTIKKATIIAAGAIFDNSLYRRFFGRLSK